MFVQSEEREIEREKENPLQGYRTKVNFKPSKKKI